jgi:SSS family solute:Na+ symporter
MIQFICFIGFISLVSVIGYLNTRKENLHTSEGYFLGGRSLTGLVIAGSMLLTNISTEHLIGMNGSAYKNGAIIVAWEVTSALALIIGAIYFVPKYLKMGLTTIPEYIEMRFDGVLRSILSFLLIISYVCTLLPIVLYTGALNIESIFDLSTMLNISKDSAIVLSIGAVGIIGAVYAIFGGLKMVATSDAINGIGLLVAGVAIPFIAFYDIGEGSIMSGISKLYHHAPQKFNVISNEPSIGPGARESILPFSVLFTGMIINQLYFWAMNQSIIQRALGAVSLKEAQKGLLITGFLKIFIPIVIVVPGIIGFYYYGDSFYNSPDEIYPTLVKRLLPGWAIGFFLAVIMGAILSTFNSALNSAATIFSFDIYRKHIDPHADDRKVVKTGKYVSTILAVGAILIAPFVAKAPDGLYQLLQQLNGIFFVPMASVILAGFFMPWISARGAKWGLFFGLSFYILTYFILKIDLHFVHIWGIEFILNIAIMTLVSYFDKTKKVVTLSTNTGYDLTPWKYTAIVSIFLTIITLLIYIFLGFNG